MTRWWLQDDDYHTTGTQKMSKRWNTENLIAQVCQIQNVYLWCITVTLKRLRSTFWRVRQSKVCQSSIIRANVDLPFSFSRWRWDPVSSLRPFVWGKRWSSDKNQTLNATFYPLECLGWIIFGPGVFPLPVSHKWKTNIFLGWPLCFRVRLFWFVIFRAN